jgi:hypothetical protein
MMDTCTSVSGGRTSAYVAANYPSDYNLFALVRIEDPQCRFPDRKIAAEVEDRIQAPFIGTAEDDMIIYTMLDLEQYLGRKINWVTGLTFEQVIKQKGLLLPNKLHRYCTTFLKMEPMFQWWRRTINEPMIIQIGYRANEINRANTMLSKCNENGLLEYHAVVGKSKTGNRNRWGNVAWEKPSFPLIEDSVYKDEITKFWKGKPVRFADYNNCVGCFHRSIPFLKYMYKVQPNKMNWFKNQEGGIKGYWKDNTRYRYIETLMEQQKLFADDFEGCDDGFCGL